MKHEAKQRDIYFSSHSLPWANSPCFYLILPGIWWDPSIPELGETDTVKTSVKTLICSLHPSLPVLVCFLQRRASIFNFFCCWGFYIPNQTTKEWYFPLVQVLGKNYMSLFKNYPSESPKILTFTLNPLRITERITLCCFVFLWSVGAFPSFIKNNIPLYSILRVLTLYIAYPHCVCVLVVESCTAFCNLMGCSLLGSSFHGILQARIQQWAAIPFSSGSSQPRDWTLQVSCFAGRKFTIWTIRDIYLRSTKLEAGNLKEEEKMQRMLMTS